MSVDLIAERLTKTRERIENAARSAGRDPGGIKLVAVSKTKSVDAIASAYAAGQRAFGENYAQELEAKALALAHLTDIEWHFIGHVQSNKAKTMATYATVVHTVDHERVARELAKRCALIGRPSMPVMIEVNVGRESQKHGVLPEDLAEVVASVRGPRELSLCGLMTVPPAGDEGATLRCFETLATLRDLHGGHTLLPELSMGMSGDVELAIAAGATVVRVGSAIFGER